MKWCYGLLVCVMCMTGCAWTRAKVNDASVVERAVQIKPGVTRGDEVAKLLKMIPTSIIPLKDGRQIQSYGYGDAKTEACSLILVTFSKTNSSFSAVYVLIDKQGIVQGVEYSPKEVLSWETWPFGE